MFDFNIEIQNKKGFVYYQIYKSIAKKIAEGKLAAGVQLPSTRLLADFLQISRSTVLNAYEQLLSEGYIEARPQKGYFVCKIEEQPEIIKKEFSSEQTISEQLIPEQKKRLSGNKWKVDFSPNGFDMSLFPFGEWRKITRNILKESNKELFSLGEPQGDFPLRETIKEYLYAARGVFCTEEQIIIGAGNDYLLMLLERILGKNIRVAMENETYLRAAKIFKTYYHQVQTAESDEQGILVPSLQKKDIQVVYVMPSHQYPKGIIMPIGRRIELLKWAGEKENRYIIEDDYDSEFRYRGKPIPSLQGIDKNQKVIYMGTFSKSIAPAIRISYMVLPMDLLSLYQQNCYFLSSTVSRIDQRILNEFIREGFFERYLNKTRKLYREKHDFLLQCLNLLETQFTVSGENAGVHVLLKAKNLARTEKELVENAKKLSVKVYPLSESCLSKNKEGSGAILLGYGGLTKTEIMEGIHLLKQAWL